MHHYLHSQIKSFQKITRSLPLFISKHMRLITPHRKQKQNHALQTTQYIKSRPDTTRSLAHPRINQARMQQA